MLEKNKDYIEFSMHTMMVTHRPYQGDAEIGITGLIPRDFIAIDNPLDIPGDVVVVPKRCFERLQVENEQLNKKLEELHKEVTWTCDELGRANSANNSWKATAECNSPKELMAKLNQFRDDIKELKERYDLAVEMIGNWQRATGQFLPNVDDDELASWKEVTGFKTPEEAKDYWATKLSESGEVSESFASEIRSWREATGCSTPEEAKEFIDFKKKHVIELNNELDVSQSAVEEAHNRTTEMEDLCMEYRDQVRSWKKATGCETPEKAKSSIKYYRARLGNSVQSASIAMKILGNSVKSEASAMKILETIGYTDPIKED